jgi:hypothetical protein
MAAQPLMRLMAESGVLRESPMKIVLLLEAVVGLDVLLS